MIPVLTTLLSSLIDKLFPDKEKQQQAKLVLLELQQKGELESLSVQLEALIAETKNPDKWISRARPTFLYVMYGIILQSIPIGIIYALFPSIGSGIIDGIKNYLLSIPHDLWLTFDIGFCGYTVARSYDKIKNKGSSYL